MARTFVVKSKKNHIYTIIYLQGLQLVGLSLTTKLRSDRILLYLAIEGKIIIAYRVLLMWSNPILIQSYDSHKMSDIGHNVMFCDLRKIQVQIET